MKKILSNINISFRKFNFTNRSFFFLNKFQFCSLDRLNIDKIKLSNKEEKQFELKEEKKVFNKEEHIIEYNSTVNWEEEVLKSEIPVVVDCYAVWCAPCKKLYPLLEKKLEENKNFKLVKINIDENGDLAEMLSISSVPSVFLVYKGNVIDNFVGLPDMKKLESFFESITLITGIGEDEKIIQAMLAGADEYMSKKIYDRAENMLNEAYSHQKWRNKYGHIIKLALGMCAYNRSDFKMAEKFAKDLKLHHKNDISADPHLNKKLSLLEMKLEQLNNPELVEKSSSDILNKIEENPKDLTLRYQLAQLQFDNSQFEEAINTLLEIIAIDRNWKDKAAQKYLIQIFNFLGQDNKLTTQGRQKLTKLLY